MTLKNAEMYEQINKSVFAMCSPPPATGILAWCLGHDQGIVSVSESN
jgi:hypothetical protein